MTPSPDSFDPQAALIAEQLRHTIDLLRSQIDTLAIDQRHASQLTSQRLTALENASQDHETRIRSLTDGVTTFKVWYGFFTGGSSLVSLLAIIRTFVGG